MTAFVIVVLLLRSACGDTKIMSGVASVTAGVCQRSGSFQKRRKHISASCRAARDTTFRLALHGLVEIHIWPDVSRIPGGGGKELRLNEFEPACCPKIAWSRCCVASRRASWQHICACTGLGIARDCVRRVSAILIEIKLQRCVEL